MSKDIALLCPGQGSQYEGMSRVLVDNFPYTKEIYEEASDAGKVNYLKLCQDGPDSELTLTTVGQPTILTTSYAWNQVLRRELDFSPVIGAGHSVGEYSALLCADAMTLSEAVPLVKERGRLMQSAVPVGVGKMAAIIGPEDQVIEALCKEASQGEESVVVPVNYNSPGQVVIAGHTEAVDRAGTLAVNKEGPYKARKFMPLNVSAPFHSPLMSPVVEAFRPALESVSWNPPKFSISFNVEGKLIDSPQIVPLLCRQLDHPVKWVSCVNSIIKSGTTHFIEMGPKKVLTGLMRRIDKSAKCFGLDSLEDFKAIETWLKEE